MSTTRQPLTAAVRSWLDFDQKFLAVFAVFIVVLVLDIGRLLLGQVSVLAAGTELAPLAVAALGAYVATSTHREELVSSADALEAFARQAGPVVGALYPQAAPVVAGVETVLQDITAPTAAAPAPVAE